jgi:polyphosphate kinase
MSGEEIIEIKETTKEINSVKTTNTKREKKMKKYEKDRRGMNLDNPSLYINRELSWLDLNSRILEEANDPSHPLLERVKFLAVCGSNLDEFFMVRVSGLKRQLMKGVLKAPPDKMTPTNQLVHIRSKVKKLLKKYEKTWYHELLPALRKEGIFIQSFSQLHDKQKQYLKDYFHQNIYPTLTPLAMDIAHPFPFISNLSINLAVIVQDPQKGEKFARLKIPTRLFPRFLEVPSYDEKKNKIQKNNPDGHTTLVLLEDAIASNIDMLFPGLKVIATYPFRITRNAEIEISLDQASDLLTAIEEGVETRRVGFPVRFQVDKSMPDALINHFANNLGLSTDFVYKFDGPLGLVHGWELLELDRPDLKDKPFLPSAPKKLSKGQDIFSAIENKDWVIYYPYDSFNIMVNLIKQAANDPDVLAIKTTMYRIDKRSPIIDALLRARENGKAVSVLVELKAKFDEENNINWARKLEEEGVHVVYGLEDLKVHAKIFLIIRKKADKISRYSLISTGNFNAVTSEIYADISYITANQEIGKELTEVFNSLTGYSQKEDYKKLIVAPKTLRKEIIRRIQREVENHKKNKGGGYIAWKLNGLVDKKIIQELYNASRAGVKIVLNVRGLCSLRPGIPGVSDMIIETSIIGRFLEHARIYYFWNNGEEEVIIGSADMMDRNLERRVEVLLEVPDARLKHEIIEHMLNIHLKDTVKARVLSSDGSWKKKVPSSKQERFNSQEWLIKNRGIWHEE